MSCGIFLKQNLQENTKCQEYCSILLVRVFWALASFDLLYLLPWFSVNCKWHLLYNGVIIYRITLKVRTDTEELILNHLLFRKRFDGKLQSESTNIGKAKRDADFEGTDEPIFGKKPRVEESVTEDLR